MQSCTYDDSSVHTTAQTHHENVHFLQQRFFLQHAMQLFYILYVFHIRILVLCTRHSIYSKGQFSLSGQVAREISSTLTNECMWALIRRETDTKRQLKMMIYYIHTRQTNAEKTCLYIYKIIFFYKDIYQYYLYMSIFYCTILYDTMRLDYRMREMI